MTGETFGKYISTIRTEREIPAETIYGQLSITAPYLYAVEHGYSAPFDEERMNQLAAVLKLTPEEEKHMRLLAAQDIAARSSCVSPDRVISYLFALRNAG
ncbi:MAG: hypothetical protein ACOX8B_00825 [Lachnospiraceae bacterium]